MKNLKIYPYPLSINRFDYDELKQLSTQDLLTLIANTSATCATTKDNDERISCGLGVQQIVYILSTRELMDGYGG